MIVLIFFLVLFSILADGYLDDEWMDGWIGLDWIGCTIASSPSGSRFFFSYSSYCLLFFIGLNRAR